MPIMSPDECTRLHNAGKRSYQAMSISRENRRNIIKDFVGSVYGNDGATMPQMDNIMRAALTTFARLTSPKNVAVMVSTPIPQYRMAAEDLALELTKVCKDINFDEAVYRCVLDALISIGIMKVGIGPGEEVGQNGESYGSGQIFLEPVDLDNFFFDTRASSFQSAAFMGDIYQVPLEDVKNDPDIDQSMLEDVKPDPRNGQNSDGSEKVSTILYDEEQNSSDFIDYVELWDYWVPRRKCVITMTKTGKKLKEIRWEGPKRGPYRILSLGEVPGNAMPSTLAQDIYPLNKAQNDMIRKVIEDELARKTITAVRKGADGDGAAVTNASNGDAVGLNDTKNVVDLKFRGAAAEAIGIIVQTGNKLKERAGNLDSVAGLAPQSPTLGQDQLIAQSSSKMVQDISERSVKFTSSLLEDVAWWQYNDPMVNMSLTKAIGNTGLSIPITITAESRRGRFEDYQFEIDPYSMRPQTPESKLQAIITWIGQVVMPTMPIAAQQGCSINVQKFWQMTGRYANISNEVSELIQVAAPQLPPPPGAVEGGGGMPAQTNRTYTRVNQSGGNQKNKDDEFAKEVMASSQE